MSLRALIVDDEAPARRRLRRLLADHDISVVGEAGTVAQAAELISARAVDLVFLDIQMPGDLGFTLFDRVADCPPVIFITAYDEYAVRAFEVNALDYLLKPIEPERLARALTRRRQRAAYDDSVEREGPTFRLDDVVAIRDADGLRFVALSSVAAFSSADDYTEVLLTSGEALLSQRSLSRWEQRLPQPQFIRIHRATLVQTSLLTEISRDEDENAYLACLHGVERHFPVSRRYLSRVRQRIDVS